MASKSSLSNKMMEIERSESDESACTLEPLLVPKGLLQASTHLGTCNATTYNRREYHHGSRRPIFTIITDFAESKLHPQSIKLQQLQKSEPKLTTRFRELLPNPEESRSRRYLLTIVGFACVLLAFLFSMSTPEESQHLNYENFYTSVPQIVVLSPEIGYLDVIGTTHHICDDNLQEYKPEDFSVSLGNAGTKFIPSLVHNHTDRSQGDFTLIARVRIGRQNWKAIIDSSKNHSSTSIATIVDKKRNKAIHKPVWIDPSLPKYYSNHSMPEPISGGEDATRQSPSSKHFLAAMITLRTNEAEYQGLNAAYYRRAIILWLEHYREIGVSRFYIVDNAPSDEPDIELLPEESEGVVYVRAHFPDEADACNGTTSVTGKVLLQNAILKAANVEWMLVIGLNDFVVPTAENGTLKSFPAIMETAISSHPGQGHVASITLPSHEACDSKLYYRGSFVGLFGSMDREQMQRGDDVMLVKTSSLKTYHGGAPNSSHLSSNVAVDAGSQAWVVKACTFPFRYIEV